MMFATAPTSSALSYQRKPISLLPFHRHPSIPFTSSTRNYSTSTSPSNTNLGTPRSSSLFKSKKWKVAGVLLLVTSGIGAFIAYKKDPLPQQTVDPNKKTLVVLGSGWGAVSLLRKLDTSQYNTIVVSPRNYFLFTPLLPSVTTGSLESRSILTPIRYFLRFRPFHVTFVEAEATNIDPKSKTIEIKDNSDIKGTVSLTRLPYDYLVISVGSESQTFGIPGVRENALFLKEIWDAKKIRSRLMDCIETAAFPGQPEEEISRLLHMVVVGGGPTGVEYAGELHDFLVDEVRKWYPEIANKVKITLIEALPNILPMFSRKMIEYTQSTFKELNIDVLTETMVKEVKQKELMVKDKDGFRSLPFGMLVWATGNTARPLIKELMQTLHQQGRGLLIDDYLRVPGLEGQVWAIGDCTQSKFAPTAQVASQQGLYLARQLNDLAASELNGIPPSFTPFAYQHRATLAYIGDDKGVSDLKLPYINQLISFSGYQSYLFWRSAYLSNTFTLRNKILVAFDWTKEKIFGRDISRE